MIYYVMPTEEELFQVRSSISSILTTVLTMGQKYNPELQRRSLANRQEKQEDFDKFVTRLKQYSKSDKPSTSKPSKVLRENESADTFIVWTEWEHQAARNRELGVQAELDRRKAAEAEAEARRQEIRSSVR